MAIALFPLAFLSIFHILGGAGLGVALRGLRRKRIREGVRENLVLIIWSLLFGGLPLAMGLAYPGLFFFQILELGGACLVAFLYWDRIRELLGNTNLLLILFGGIFFSTGCGIGALLLKTGEVLRAVLVALPAGGLGLGLVVFGLYRSFFVPTDAEDES